MMFLKSLLLLVSFASTAISYQNPGSCSGACNVHDPAVIRRASDGTYFRFSTGNKIQIATSSSLSGPWTIKGSALPGGSKINLAGNQDLWAPDVTKVGDTYYLYYSVSTFGSQESAIGIATSTTMEVGTWTDYGSTGVSSRAGRAYNAIDGNVVLAGDGSYYMSFGSFWGDIYNVGLPWNHHFARQFFDGATLQVPMRNPPLTVSGSSTRVAYNSTGSHAIEGAFIWYRSPYYYLFFSAGICCGYDNSRPAQGMEYRINVCRSTSVNSGYVLLQLLKALALESGRLIMMNRSIRMA